MAPDLWDVAGLGRMLQAAAGRVSDRKLDLFNGWCCHALRPYLTDPRSRAAARFIDAHIDEACPDPAGRAALLLAAKDAVEDLARWAKSAPTGPESRRRRVYLFAAQIVHQTLAHDLPNRGALANAQFTAFAFAWANDDRGMNLPETGELRDEHLKLQAAVFRDIVGNPFRPVAFDPRWRTADTTGLARAIYEDRAFNRLPLLADALMDAGCDDDRLLDHCRVRGPHARGCWVVDLILSKDR